MSNDMQPDTIPSNQACAIGPQESYEVCRIDANRLAGDEDWATEQEHF